MWTRADILFDGNEVLGAKPIHEAIADRASHKASTAVETSLPQRRRDDTSNYTVAELAREWSLSTDKVRELFRNEPGVIKLTDADAGKNVSAGTSV